MKTKVRKDFGYEDLKQVFNHLNVKGNTPDSIMGILSNSESIEDALSSLAYLRDQIRRVESMLEAKQGW